MKDRIVAIATSVSLNQTLNAAVCTVEAQAPGAENQFVVNVVGGKPFEAGVQIHSFFDQYGNVNLMVPHPNGTQQVWVQITWSEFKDMFLALAASASFKNPKTQECIEALLRAFKE
jgi:hypothetical protein